MKKILAALLLISTAAAAQQEQLPFERGFKKQNIFSGGSLNLGASSGSFTVGAIPEIGYSVAEWLDAGLVFNLNYQSFSARYNNGFKSNNFNYGAGGFVRLYPLRFLFFQAQPEHNWTTIRERDVYNTNTLQVYHMQSTSFLTGVGYSSRVIGQTNFYLLLMIDLMTDINSPYRNYGNQATPVVRTGFNFYLHPARKK